MKTLKKITFILLMFLSVFAIACKKSNSNNSTNTGKTGTFKIDGVTYNGSSETQTFSNGNYSIVCQQDDPFKFIQITFHSKAEAEAGGTFTVADYALNVPTGKVNIGTSEVVTSNPNNTSYTINVSGNKITISSNMTITSTGGSGTTTTIGSSSINF